MGRHGCNRQEEGPFTVDRIVQKSEGFLCDHVGCMMTLVADWWVIISLVSRVEICVGVGIEEKIGAVEPLDMGAVIIVDGMSVEELAGVVGVVASFLEPHWQEVLVESAIHKLGVSSWTLSAAYSDSEVPRQHSPYGGLTSVTFVLCAWRPVHKLTREGQQSAVVTK